MFGFDMNVTHSLENKYLPFTLKDPALVLNSQTLPLDALGIL
jgi:hypothetical protein